MLARSPTIPASVRGSLRIAQVAPLYESVPPTLYGGTERVVSYLTEELVKLGHRVTLFASGDSRTSAELEQVQISDLKVGAASVDLTLHRYPGAVGLNVERRKGNVEVAMLN